MLHYTTEELSRLTSKTMAMLARGDLITELQASERILYDCVLALKEGSVETADVAPIVASVPLAIRERMKNTLEARETTGRRQWWPGWGVLATPFPIKRPLEDDAAVEGAIQRLLECLTGAATES